MKKPIFDIDNIEQQQAYELIANTNTSFFLTGRAGTGKTTFLRNIQQVVDKQFVTIAPTGIAAILAGGETIHSFFGLPLQVCSPGDCGKINELRQEKIKRVDTIIIDEVSMVRCDIVDAIDLTLRKVLRNHQPFGGKQVVFIGDLFQLPPIVRAGVEFDLLRDLYNTDEFFFYKSKVFCRNPLVKIELRKVYRQDELQFLRVLDNVRLNRITTEDIELLNARVCKPLEFDEPIISLVSLNKAAHKINQTEMDKLQTPEFSYEGTVNGDFEDSKLPVDKNLKLKVGAQVIFTRNDIDGRWVNGSIGRVVELEQDKIEVEVQGGLVFKVDVCEWENYRYEYDRDTKKIKKEVIGIFNQYPLKLAWAITIHKSQGMTFDAASIDLTHGFFAPGQLYVALSRIRSLRGLFLSRSITSQDVLTNKDVVVFSASYNNKDLIDREISFGKLIAEAVGNKDFDTCSKYILLKMYDRMVQGEVREALIEAKHFLDEVVCDEMCFGCFDGEFPLKYKCNHWTIDFLKAIFYLYSNQFDNSLQYVEKVISQHKCVEANYIKVRCLSKLGRHQDADVFFGQLLEDLDMNIPDLKLLYQVALHNEYQVNDPGILMIKILLENKPDYYNGVVKLREIMMFKNLKLVNKSDDQILLLEMFNSEMSNDEFEKDILKSLKLDNANYLKFIEILTDDKC